MANDALHSPPTLLDGEDRNGRAAALGKALEGVELGAHDLRVLDWLAGWEPATVATIVSLVRRARAAELDAAVQRIETEAVRQSIEWNALPEDDQPNPTGRSRWIDGMRAAARQIRRAE